MSAVLTRKASRVADKLARIAELLPATVEAFTGDRSVRDLCGFYLALTIEDCVDMAEHIISTKGLGAPDSSAEAFRMLAGHQLLAPPLAEKMVQANGMRNAILHQYDDLDWARVYAALCDVSRIEQFVASVLPAPGHRG